MIGKIVGAFLGGKVAQRTRGIEGPTGAALGVLAPMLLRRLSWPAIAALGVGSYLAKRMIDRGPDHNPGQTSTTPRPPR